MDLFWLMDSKRRRVGPIDLSTVEELAKAGRIGAMTRASRDGAQWTSAADIPELARVLVPAPLAEQWARQREEASVMLLLVDQYQEQPTPQLFGVGDAADLKTLRRGFLALAKRYHPARLPKDVHPELLKASMEMFQLLSGRMVTAERELSAAAPPTPEPQYGPDAFVGLTRTPEGKVSASVAVNPGNALMFTAHKIVNLATKGVFLRTDKRVALGTALDLVFHFGDPRRDIQASGTVVFDSPPEQKQPSGFGVRFWKLADDDQRFIKDYLGRAQLSR